MSPRELGKLLTVLRRNGVVRYVTPDLTLEIGPAPAPAMRAGSADTGEPTEEDLSGHPSAFMARYQRERREAKGQ
jgi:hypothetical protein